MEYVNGMSVPNIEEKCVISLCFMKSCVSEKCVLDMLKIEFGGEKISFHKCSP